MSRNLWDTPPTRQENRLSLRDTGLSLRIEPEKLASFPDDSRALLDV